MAATKKKEKPETDTVRVNLSLTPEEYELLSAKAEEEKRQPGTMAKLLVMKALEASSK